MRVALRSKIKRLRYGYQDTTGKWRGGFIVSDRLAQRPSGLLFSEPRGPASTRTT
jgi:hypothetical protein